MSPVSTGMADNLWVGKPATLANSASYAQGMEMSTSWSEVKLWAREVLLVWLIPLVDKTCGWQKLCEHLLTCAIPECLRDKQLIIKCYINWFTYFANDFYRPDAPTDVLPKASKHKHHRVHSCVATAGSLVWIRTKCDPHKIKTLKLSRWKVYRSLLHIWLELLHQIWDALN